MDLSDVQQQMSSGLNFGIMNALRTGNPILDVMVCMLIPVILSLFMGNSNSDPMSTKIKDSARFLTLGWSGKSHRKTLTWEFLQRAFPCFVIGAQDGNHRLKG